MSARQEDGDEEWGGQLGTPSLHQSTQLLRDSANYQFPWQPAPAQLKASVASLTYIQLTWRSHAALGTCPGEKRHSEETCSSGRDSLLRDLTKGTDCPHSINFLGPVLVHFRPALCKLAFLICNILPCPHQGIVTRFPLAKNTEPAVKLQAEGTVMISCSLHTRRALLSVSLIFQTDAQVTPEEQGCCNFE